MRPAKGFAIALVAGLLLTAAIVGTAWALRADSEVHITRAIGDQRQVTIIGEVTSSKDDCIKRRRVRVYHDVPPPGESRNDFLLGGVNADKDGHWVFESKLLPGKVYAKIARKKGCRGDKSPTERVDYR